MVAIRMTVNIAKDDEQNKIITENNKEEGSKVPKKTRRIGRAR